MSLNPKHYLFAVLCIAISTVESTSANEDITQSDAMVVTANPHATEAGLEIIRAGGSAIDAAVAIEAVLSLVEPQSSGLGGGGFLVHYDAKAKEVIAYDGRETAPAGAKKDLFYAANGKRLGFLDAKHSGLSIGVPGVVAMLALAHKDYGKLSWNKLFSPAKKLSIEGFPVSPRMHHSIDRFKTLFPDTPDKGPTEIYKYLFTDDGKPLPIGYILKNQKYAKTLDIIAENPSAFYKGALAEEMSAIAQVSPRPGTLSHKDLENYSARKLKPYCSAYRDMTLCGSPLPSSWISVSMVMGLLIDAPKFSEGGAKDVANWNLLAEALRITYADNNKFIADNKFIDVPVAGLMNKEYIKSRAKLISIEKANPFIKAGNPWKYQQNKSTKVGKDDTYDTSGTTHFVVVDNDGNVVSMTATVEGFFGSLRMAGGMILNNQLTDFSFAYEDAEGIPIANAVASGKRPRSSMSPTIVLDKNEDFLMTVGSPGGRSIISYVAKALVGVLDWDLTMQEAINLPNMVAKSEVVKIERSRASKALINSLKAYGYKVKQSDGEISGLSGIVRLPDGSLSGGADPRREGTIGVYAAKKSGKYSVKQEHKHASKHEHHKAAEVYIIEPLDGAIVPSTFTVRFGAKGINVAAANSGMVSSGHHHLLIDSDKTPKKGMPMGSNVKHFVNGETETTLTLEKGVHTLQLIIGDNSHVPMTNMAIPEKITITVK